MSNRYPHDSEGQRFVQATLDVDGAGRWSRYLVYMVALGVLCIIGWAAYFDLDEVTVANGKVIPSSRGQVVQILETGILRDLKVREGQQVRRGEVLLELDDTRAGPLYRETQEKWRSLLAQAARLNAEAYGIDLEFPATVRDDPSLLRRETQAYETRKNALEEQLAALTKTRATLQREIELIAPLVRQGVMSEVELLRLRREESGLEGQTAEIKARYLTSASLELVRVDSELKQVSAIMSAHRDAYNRTKVLSPADGIVKDINFHTIGAIISSGDVIMEIVPINDEMLVEAFVEPSEIAHIKVGQSARVKLSAYDSRRYGELEGVVKLISPDTLIEDHKMASRTPTTSVNFEPGHYKLLIQIVNPGIERGNMQMTPQPGMTATVDILTGHKSVLEYLFRPLENVKEALRER